MNRVLFTETREAGGIRYTLKRKNIRKSHLYVKPDGSVTVTAPLLYPAKDADGFVESKAGWILKNQEKFRRRPAQENLALRYVSGETLFFWGRPYVLEAVEEAGRKRAGLELIPEPVFSLAAEDMELIRNGKLAVERCIPDAEPGRAVLRIPAGSTEEQRERTVKRKYKELLDGVAGSMLDFWAEETGLRYSEWHSRYMTSRWGSLSVRDRRVCLSTRLSERPEVCLLYVALHETAHIKEADHGPGFKAVLDRYMPGWRDAERLLKRGYSR